MVNAIFRGILNSLLELYLPLLSEPSMKALFKRTLNSLFPKVPPAIRDEFTILTATQMQRQARLLNLALAITVPTAIYAASADAPPFVQYGLPIIMGVACLLGALSLFRDLKLERSVRRSAKLIRQATWFSSMMAVVCSSWCVISWLTASDAHKVYYPLILSMGSLATGYCLASARRAAILNLVIGILPISTLLLLSGDRMDLAAGTSLLVATGFLLRMVLQQHTQLVDLLELKRQMRDLANTDPLTGLINRRAFSEKVEHALAASGPDASFAFALLDLDGFKPVNDQFGHTAGDDLLKDIAARLRDAFGGDGVVARLGGDEFAILVLSSAPQFRGVAQHALAALVAPFSIAGRPTQIGASIGVSHFPADGANMHALFEAADQALYAAKADRIVPPADRAKQAA
jgi:diguanylate cyclase